LLAEHIEHIIIQAERLWSEIEIARLVVIQFAAGVVVPWSFDVFKVIEGRRGHTFLWGAIV
jgi:hypothetical protein